MSNGSDESIAGCWCLVIFIVSIVLFSCSFDTLEPRYYGLIYDDSYKTVIRDEIKREISSESGRFLIGLGRKVLSFPRGLVVMEWMPDGIDNGPMECWTSNGQNVYIDLSLQVKLKKENIPNLYYRFGQHWRDHLRLMIQNVVKDTTTQFHTLEYFTRRLAISQTFSQEMENAFMADGGYFTVVDLQLRKIGLPEAFETAILNKILKKQEQQKMANTQLVEIKRAEKSRQTALAEADSELVNEQALQEGRIAVSENRVTGEAGLLRLYATMYRKFGDEMGWLAEPDRFGYKALHYFIYSRLGHDNNARDKGKEMIGFGSGYAGKTNAP